MGKLKSLPFIIIVLLFSIIALFPFYIMLVMGTYVSEDLFTGIKLLPGDFLLGNLRSVFSHNFFLYYYNSFYIAVIPAVTGTFLSALTGFAFAKYRFKFKKALYILILGTLMIPTQLGLVGFVIEMKWFKMMNSHWPLIVPPMANAFGVFWMTQYIGGAVPNELLESARVDGSSDFRTFVQIVFPIIKPAVITIFLLLFLNSWNSYLVPLVVLNRESLYTIPLYVNMLDAVHRTDYAAKILALAMSTLPIMVIFSIGSKYLIQGLTAGSIKE
jgi:cellobiose transport system permease protein